MKHILHTLCAAMVSLIATTSLQAQSTIGYTTGNMGKNTVCRSGSKKEQGLAIRLSHEKLQPLAGHTIGSVKLAFGSRNTTGKVAELFLATDIDDDPILTQEVSIAAANKWQTINLDAPYTITGQEEALYVGYTAEIGTTYSLLQCDHENELRGCSFALNNGHWTDLYGTGYGSANIYLNFTDEVQFIDAMLAEVDLSNRYYKAGQPYLESTHVFNFGTTPITQMRVLTRKDGNLTANVIDGLNIPQYGTYEVALPELIASESGASELYACVDMFNAEDYDQTDNEFRSSIFFYPEQMERNILVEEFTGQTCPNCPAGQVILLKAVEQSGLPCVEVMHHAGYSADNFTSDADAEYTWFYGSNSTYAPAAMFNRLANPAYSAVPVQNIGLNECLNSLNYANQLQPYVSMALTPQFDTETRQLDVHLSLVDHNELPGTTVLNVYLIQDSVIGSQSGGNGEYMHNGLLRRVLTGNAWGKILPSSFVPGQTQDYDVSYELPEAIYSDYYSGSNPNYLIPTDPEHMRIVAYVASYDTRDVNNNMVYNCLEVPLIDGSYTQQGMTSSLIIPHTSLPSTGIYDLRGRQYDTDAHLPAGLYIIDGHKVMINE